jgi:hypothetical protein
MDLFDAFLEMFVLDRAIPPMLWEVFSRESVLVFLAELHRAVSRTMCGKAVDVKSVL